MSRCPTRARSYHLEYRGLLLKSGMMADATLIDQPLDKDQGQGA